MTDESLLTLRQLAEELKLPESTVRYYRDAFLDHIPSVGTGRRRRYPPEAAAVLRSIAKSYSAGRSRPEIIAGIHAQQGTTAPTITVGAERPSRAVPLEEVTNLDLLAAILDGEREQRDALWQMAKEIVRLTEVLESQDKVLTGIADKAGIVVNTSHRVTGGAAPVASLAAPAAASSAIDASASSAAPSPPMPRPIEPIFGVPAPRPAPAERAVELPPSREAGGDMDRLRSELEKERELVERLREAKLQLEHRAADAEAALEDKGKRRGSVIGRLLRNDEPR